MVTPGFKSRHLVIKVHDLTYHALVNRKVKVSVAQLSLALCDPMDYTAMEFSRPEYWSG